ncbi:tetratricopeptide repeat protein [Spirosoma sp. RP8]|uniref:Tetratricopeptide repeat protein n=1 Tax=Spirosoma liriopis TaxID=2937440 RepID=A0ABT0HIZ8_9BACT|nr:tetratricopeptide repeat protein [Spirosoma liriopis]MCK8492139.1 tetratricopeptide repeat protein [Spirosoma liriopis]
MNVRMNLVQWSLVMMPMLSLAQPKRLITSARPNSVQTVSNTTTATERQTKQLESTSTDTTPQSSMDVNTLPLFGERAKTAAQIDEEIHFLNDCDRNFASRPEASEFFAARGWDYIQSGQLDTAAHRFNLAWLLDAKNADAYWGLGVVCYQKENLPDAIRMLKKGLAVTDSNAVLMTDLATLQIKHFQIKAVQDDLLEAEQHLQRSLAISPENAGAYQKLSLVNYLKADYDKAWELFHQAYSLDLSVLDLAYLNDLLAKRPDPTGKFK